MDQRGVQEQLLATSDPADFGHAFESLLLLYAASDTSTTTIEFCSELLGHADEIGLDTEAWIKVSMPLMESLKKRGAFAEALMISKQMEARLKESALSTNVYIECLCRMAFLATATRHLDHAGRLLRDARLRVTNSNDVSLWTMALYHFTQGQFDVRARKMDAAISSFEAAAAAYGLLGQESNVAMATGQKARAQMLAGYPALAKRFFSTAIELPSVDKRAWVTLAANYSICLLWLGEWDQANSLLDRAIHASSKLEMFASQIRVNTIRALVAVRRNELDAAANLSRDAMHNARTTNLVREEICALECLGEIEYERGNPAAAIKIYEECIAKGEAVGMSDATTEGKRREAEAWNALGEHDKALAAARRAIEVAETNEDRYEHAVAHRPLGVANSMLGEKDEAEKAFRRGIEEIRVVGDPFELAKTLVELARHLREWDPSTLELGAAGEHLREARQLFEKLGVEKWIQRVDEDINEVIRLTEATAESPSGRPDGNAVHTGSGKSVERGVKSIRSVTIITQSREILDTLERLARVASSPIPVLITGESGTGKELFARALQELSGRPPDRYVAVNCAALPRELHESELFGHARGSFTGSTSEKPGLFELADGGTIFLDEIGDLDPGAQGKLLRVLENGELRRVGELKSRRVDARVVAATNRDLVQSSREGTFRGDLFHRLNGLPVRVPSLRERPGDIEPLARYFLDIYQASYKKRVVLPPDLLAIYQDYRWPGNVRELRQEIHRMVLLTADGGTIRTADSEVVRLAASDQSTALAEASGLASAVGEHERRLILDAMHRSSGNKAQAARLLNMSRTTLIGKIRRLGIE
jgi:transcriptional regulator with PAS, ATPase and Fis domain